MCIGYTNIITGAANDHFLISSLATIPVQKNMMPKYKFAVIAVDVIIFTIKNEELQVLLIKMKKKPYKDCWAAPGGLIGLRENCEQAAKRQLSQKARVGNVYLEQLYTFSEINRDPFGRVVSVAYFALLPPSGLNLKTTAEYADVGWHPVNQLPKMAYDHKKIINAAAKRLKAKLGYTNIVCNLLPESFTLTDLQRTYEIILGRKLDKRNFRKKILSLKLIRKLKQQRKGVANRPAELYKFARRKPQIVEIL